MVAASMYARFLKEQETKEKRRLEKEAAEERRKEVIEKYKLERKLAEGLEAKLFRLEQPREYSKLRHELSLRKIKETKKKVETKKKIVRTYIKTRDEFIFTEEDKAKCREKTLDQLVDDIGGSQLVCPPGKELKKDIDKKELTADIKCFRKRVRIKSPEEIVALYDKLLATDPERLCKEKKE